MQAGLDKRQRQKALDQVFQWADGTDPRPGPAILVDDVVTTGATLESCGSILRERGYGPIWGLTFAGGSGLSMGNHNLPI
jgi:predicted amidophosphoribosyltransferase